MLLSNPSSSKPKPIVLILAVYQLLGGLVGLFFLLKMGSQMLNAATSSWLGVLLGALLYSFSVVCGFLLFKSRRSAFTLSLVNQVLQVFSAGMVGWTFNYVAGLKVGLGIEFVPDWLLKAKLSLSSFTLSLGSGMGGSFVTVNFLALVLLYLLEKYREQAPASQ
ncbi:hypothetical protein GU926_18300 [Nibribacter ruber]|uniref:DUF4199 family protein n=1 Tax=Nibribacter ruber TaxID=2698458 RepID=A0A6P1P4L9_9BACT|nr:hypothetical protein [Nibribacter ruber]QHL89278.1 hypothetical protein GU926_18300 [Nibribacter ruber]